MSDTRWLTEDEQAVWRGYMRVHATLAARLNRNLTAHSGLSGPDYEVLVHLSEAPRGTLRAFELGRALHWEKSRLSHHLRRMTVRGLITRNGCDTDRRGIEIVITKTGRQAIERAAANHVADVRRYFIDALSPAQLRHLGAIVAAVQARLDEDPVPACE